MKPVITPLLTIGLLFVLNSYVQAQTKIISRLKQNVAVANTGNRKLQALLDLCEQGHSMHPDTLLQYAATAGEYARGLHDNNSEARAVYFIAAGLTSKGLLDSALAVAGRQQQILETSGGNPVQLANLLGQRGRCYVRKNNYKKAIEMGYATVSIGEKANDVLQQVKGKTLIGWAYLEMGQYTDALNWHLKALHTTSDSTLLQQYASVFSNLATTYNNLGQTDSALYYIQKAIGYARKFENLLVLSNSLAIASAINVAIGKPKNSEPLLKEMVATRKLIGDPFYTASDLAELGTYYAHYGQPEKGIAVCREGIALARKYNLSTKLFFLYQSLADNYRAMGKIDDYAATMSDIIRLKDSVYATNSSDELAEMSARYELQKKEKTIIQQEYQLLQKNYWIYGAAALLLFGVALWYVNYRNNKRRQEIKMTLALMEEKRIAEKAIAVAQELERKRIAADLHDNLGAYAAAISANVDHISATSGPRDTSVYQELKNNAQSIVSQLNDTIWVLTKERLALTSISDRLKVFIQRIGKSYPNIQVDVKEDIATDQTLAPMQALNLFKILQEGIINALKHSRCSRVMITIHSNGGWKMIIEDDGIGMQQHASTSTDGNGVSNMKKRSADAGWNIVWEANSPAGTRVVVTPTTN